MMLDNKIGSGMFSYKDIKKAVRTIKKAKCDPDKMIYHGLLPNGKIGTVPMNEMIGMLTEETEQEKAAQS